LRQDRGIPSHFLAQKTFLISEVRSWSPVC